MMVVLAIHGIGEKGDILPAKPSGEIRQRPEAVFRERLADHPADRDRAQHEGHEERDAEEFAAANVGVQREREAKGDRVLNDDRRHVEDHVAERVPKIGVGPKGAQIVEAVEMRVALRVEVPVGEGDGETKQGREDHHGAGEQESGQHEQSLPPELAVLQDLRNSQRYAPDKERVKGRPPVGEADRSEARRFRDLQRCDDN